MCFSFLRSILWALSQNSLVYIRLSISTCTYENFSFAILMYLICFNFIVNLKLSSKNVQNAKYFSRSRTMLIFSLYAHSARGLFQLTFWFTLLAHINLQSRKAQCVRKQCTIWKISTISSTPPFPVLSFQFDNSLFASLKLIRCLLKMDWRSSRNHEISGFEIVWSYLHNHAVLALEVFQQRLHKVSKNVKGLRFGNEPCSPACRRS